MNLCSQVIATYAWLRINCPLLLFRWDLFDHTNFSTKYRTPWMLQFHFRSPKDQHTWSFVLPLWGDISEFFLGTWYLPLALSGISLVCSELITYYKFICFSEFFRQLLSQRMSEHGPDCPCDWIQPKLTWTQITLLTIYSLNSCELGSYDLV